MWDAIKTNFRQRSDIKRNNLRNEVFSLRYNSGGNENLCDYTLRFRALVNQLKDLNDGMTEQEYILQY